MKSIKKVLIASIYTVALSILLFEGYMLFSDDFSVLNRKEQKAMAEYHKKSQLYAAYLKDFENQQRRGMAAFYDDVDQKHDSIATEYHKKIELLKAKSNKYVQLMKDCHDSVQCDKYVKNFGRCCGLRLAAMEEYDRKSDSLLELQYPIHNPLTRCEFLAKQK